MPRTETLSTRVTRLEEKWTRLDDLVKSIDELKGAMKETLDKLNALPCKQDAMRLTVLETNQIDHAKRIRDIEEWQNNLIGKLAILAIIAVAASSAMSAYLVSIFTQ